MATAQTSKSAKNDKNKSSRSSARASGAQSATGERDENYNLVSVLYHALQGAETLTQYKEDAGEQGDQELADFFEEARGSYVEVAQQAKALLADRLDQEGSGDEDEDEEDDEE